VHARELTIARTFFLDLDRGDEVLKSEKTRLSLIALDADDGAS